MIPLALNTPRALAQRPAEEKHRNTGEGHHAQAGPQPKGIGHHPHNRRRHQEPDAHKPGNRGQARARLEAGKLVGLLDRGRHQRGRPKPGHRETGNRAQHAREQQRQPHPRGNERRTALSNGAPPKAIHQPIAQQPPHKLRADQPHITRGSQPAHGAELPHVQRRPTRPGVLDEPAHRGNKHQRTQHRHGPKRERPRSPGRLA